LLLNLWLIRTIFYFRLSYFFFSLLEG
jgi:hypothetical protein